MLDVQNQTKDPCIQSPAFYLATKGQWPKQLHLRYTASTIMDTAITDCECKDGYNRKVMFPIPNVSDTTMNQIAYHQYWAVIEAPVFCTNGGFHEYCTATVPIDST